MTANAKAPAERRPLVTIVLMAYNQEGIVGDAVQSCLDQTYSPLEIILSDDSSTDGTWRVIESLANAYEGPHKVLANRTPRNLGLAEHMNTLMEMSSGTLIMGCAGDDILLPQRAERLVAAWRDAPASTRALSASYVRMSFDGEDLGVVTASSRRRWKAEPEPKDVVGGDIWCVGATMVWHRDVFERFGPIPPNAPHEDSIIMLRATLLGKVVYVDEPLVRKRLGGVSNPTGKRSAEGYFDTRRLMNDIAIIEAYQIDIGKISDNRREGLLRACRRRIAPIRLQLRLLEMSRRRRYAEIPSIIWTSVTRLHLGYLVAGLKAVFSEVYLSYRRLRHR